MNIYIPFFLFMLFGANLSAQSNAFHSLNMPVSSPPVLEKQKIGITYITIDYHSPVLRGRDVWHDERVVPMNGAPFPWRAGANLNTTIEFSTDVMINGNPLPSGKYGFHIIPTSENNFTLLFAHANHQWGSYYVDVEKDITLQVPVQGQTCPNSENLDYEFENRKEDQVDIALHWGTKSIPFTVSVDLNKTVVSSLRHELRGINTYRWEAWNDAATWCLRHDTNLEEALEWANHSINGGYGGFAANKNPSNMRTKALLEEKLGMKDDYNKTIQEMVKLDHSPDQADYTSQYFMKIGRLDEALVLLDRSLKKHPETWYLYLDRATVHYGKKNTKQMNTDISKAKELVPERYREYLLKFEKGLLNKTYKL